MSLEVLISQAKKSIAGSRTKNRLTVQVSYAIQLIMDFYEHDFIVLMDYIEDISIVTDPENPTGLRLYQIKTKSADKQYSFATVIKDEWYQKLFHEARNYAGYVESAEVVCNTDVVEKKKSVFPNERTCLVEKSIEENVGRLKSAIAKYEGIDINAVDLSRYYFVRTALSTKGHRDEMEYRFGNFLLERESEVQVAAVKAIYDMLYKKLDICFGNEVDEECTDINEIYLKKGLSAKHVKEVISCGLSLQIPAKEKIFDEFNVVSVSERRRLSKFYTQIKTDMYANIHLFSELRRQIVMLIKRVNEEGIDDMPEILTNVYERVTAEIKIPEAYSSESYIKMLIMIMTYRYCNGSDL